MVITYVKPGTEIKAGENVPVALQHYPGPLKYPFMHSFLSTFAGMMGCAPSKQGRSQTRRRACRAPWHPTASCHAQPPGRIAQCPGGINVLA